MNAGRRCAGWAALLLSPFCLFSSAAEENADRPVRIIQQVKFEFPRKLLRSSITAGDVRVYLDVDAQGRLVDHLIVGYTHYEFANVVSRTLGRWRFEPAVASGRPVACTLAMNVRFEVNGVMVAERTRAEDPPHVLRSFTFRARELDELDRVPAVLATVAPRNPAAANEPAITGKASVEFFIDENGDVRMPVVTAADDVRLGWAAVAAIEQWQFEPPRRGGHPVLAHAAQTFVYVPEE